MAHLPMDFRLVRLAVPLLAVMALDSTPRAIAPAPTRQTLDSRTSVAPTDALQAWISQHAIIVRSIDPMDENFSDLEPLIDAIGSARVVQLGEPSHGAGSAFAAKVRLVKFLHRRMGFDVLAWESGLYDVRLAQAAMRGGEDPVAAAQRGILTIWSNAQEVRPLFDYVKATHGTTRPLEMVGMDMQVSAPATDERLAGDLRSFAAALRDLTRRRDFASLIDRTIAAYGRLLVHARARAQKAAESSKAGLTGTALAEAMRTWEQNEGQRLRPTRAAFDNFLAAANGLLTAISANRAALEEVHGTREVAFMERAVENMRGRGATAYDNERADPPSGSAWTNEAWNRRDALMAGNLRWLIEEGYPGRKVIVWAHNVHVMNAYFAQEWGTVHAKPQRNGKKPAGASLAEWLKDKLYTIAITTYQGEDAWANFQQSGSISPAPEGSVEFWLHQLDRPQVFLDLKSARIGKGHPLRTPQSMRISGYGPPTSLAGNDRVPDPTIAFDAIFYIDRMAPATPICFGPCPATAPPSGRE